MVKKNIYVIEDDPGIQDIMKIILDAAGYETCIYNSGGDLLQK